MGFDITDAHVQRQAVGHALAVAGQQQLAAQAQVTQLLQGLARFGFDAVGQQQPGEELAVQRQPGNRAIMGGHGGGDDAQLFKQLRPSQRRFALLGLGDHAQALTLADVAKHPHLLLARQPRQRSADRVTACRTKAGRQVQQLLAIRRGSLDGLQAQGAKGQGAGLVDHQ